MEITENNISWYSMDEKISVPRKQILAVGVDRKGIDKGVYIELKTGEYYKLSGNYGLEDLVKKIKNEIKI